jgi:hypothetical protein
MPQTRDWEWEWEQSECGYSAPSQLSCAAGSGGFLCGRNRGYFLLQPVCLRQRY